MNDYVIITERLGLRRWKDEDVIPFTAMNVDAEVMRYLPSTLNYDETVAMMSRIRSHFDQHGFGLFAIEDIAAKAFIGYIGFMIPLFTTYFTPCIEIGWRLERSLWNKRLCYGSRKGLPALWL
jgi:RimJ/RimL family protein N-acetyltransferase